MRSPRNSNDKLKNSKLKQNVEVSERGIDRQLRQIVRHEKVSFYVWLCSFDYFDWMGVIKY